MFLILLPLLVLFFLFFSIETVMSSASPLKKEDLKYRTVFGMCPSRVAGNLTLKLVKDFEENHSLRNLKMKIEKESLTEKYFLSQYKIDFDPLRRLLRLNFNCPAPLMKVQIYKSSGVDSYEAILVENGKLFDPTYEVLLRQEKKLDYDLPYLAIPVGEIDGEFQEKISHLVANLDVDFRKKISEVILNETNELTLILSVDGHPSSVFLGEDVWGEKLEKLQKIVGYMESKKKMPAIINLTNSKKVVVKFNDKL